MDVYACHGENASFASRQSFTFGGADGHGTLVSGKYCLGLAAVAPPLPPSKLDDLQLWARPAASPSPNFVPGLPHVILIEWMQALFSYQDYHICLPAPAGQASGKRQHGDPVNQFK